MKDFIIIFITLVLSFISSILAYILGKSKEKNNQLINNEKIKKQFGKNNINNIDDVNNKLQNGKF